MLSLIQNQLFQVFVTLLSLPAHSFNPKPMNCILFLFYFQKEKPTVLEIQPFLRITATVTFKTRRFREVSMFFCCVFLFALPDGFILFPYAQPNTQPPLVLNIQPSDFPLPKPPFCGVIVFEMLHFSSFFHLSRKEIPLFTSYTNFRTFCLPTIYHILKCSQFKWFPSAPHSFGP